MQTIFLAQNRNGACRELKCEPAPKYAGGFWLGERLDINDYPPPGECREYRLVPVGEADDKDARIATLETKLKNAETYGKAMADDNRDLREQLSARSPGVMAECVENLLNACQAFEGNEGECIKAIQHEANKVREYYAPPAGYEWQPVDADHPITAEDVNRDLLYQPTKISKVYGGGGWTTKGYILRPIAPKFVFTGEPGRYIAKWEDDNETPEECEICHPHNFPAGTFAALWDDGDWTKVNADGTFPGGRIVGRV